MDIHFVRLTGRTTTARHAFETRRDVCCNTTRERYEPATIDQIQIICRSAGDAFACPVFPAVAGEVDRLGARTRQQNQL